MKIQLTADLEESDLARLFPDGDPFTRRCVISEIVGLLQSKLQDSKVSASIQAHEEQAPAADQPGAKPIADIRRELEKGHAALLGATDAFHDPAKLLGRVQKHLINAINALADLEAHQAPAAVPAQIDRRRTISQC